MLASAIVVGFSFKHVDLPVALAVYPFSKRVTGMGEGLGSAVLLTLEAVIFLIVAAAHGYRIYAGIPVEVAHHTVPMVCSWYGAGISAVLGLLLLAFGRK